MNLFEAELLAKSLMRLHGLDDWRFSFDHSRRRFGRCDYTGRRITLSKTLVFLNPLEEVRDTLLHEIAHALTPGAKHGRPWRDMCRQIGARPMRCYGDAQVVSPARQAARYWLGCPHCQWWVERRRRIRRRVYLCTHCRAEVVYRDRDDSASLKGLPI